MQVFSQKRWQQRDPLERQPGQSVLDYLLLSRAVQDEARLDDLAQAADLLLDPFLFDEMEIATARIIQALLDHERILIFGDYDCDGLTSTALLYHFLEAMGATPDYRIPDRIDDGYGLSEALVDEILADPPGLLITVDCGSSSQAELKRLAAAGVGLIVTDHHEFRSPEKVALATLNPCHPDESYPFKQLAGVGVTLKLVMALAERLDPAAFPAINSYPLERCFALAALGTVADSMRMEGENRAILKLGLAAFRRCDLGGLSVLLQKIRQEQPIDETFLGFGLAPRINAAGRLSHLEAAIRLLLSPEREHYARWADELEALNSERRALEARIYEEALAQIEANPACLASGILVLTGETWHAGVIGIVCARLVEAYGLPVICFAPVGGELRGSGRAPEGYDLLELIAAGAAFTLKYGGHLQAAGVSLLPEHFAAFRAALEEQARESHQARPSQTLTYDLTLNDQDCDLQVLDQIESLAPFGNGFERPLFVLRHVEIQSLVRLGQGKHAKLMVKLADGRSLAVIAFRAALLDAYCRAGDRVDLLGDLTANVWNGRRSLQLALKDLQIPPSGQLLWDHPELLEDRLAEGAKLDDLAEVYQLRPALLQVDAGTVLNILQGLDSLLAACQLKTLRYSPALLGRALCRHLRKAYSPFQMQRALELAAAAGLCRLNRLDDCNWQLLKTGPCAQSVVLEPSACLNDFIERGFYRHG